MISLRAFSFATLGLLVACSSKEQKDESATTHPSAHASAHAAMHGSAHASSTGAPMATGSAASTAAASGAGAATAPAGGWVGSVPAKPVTAKVGDFVLALIPGASPDTATFGVVKIDSVQGTLATTLGLGADGKPDPAAKHAGTPGAIFLPALAPSAAKAKVKDVVIAAIGGSYAAGHVTKITGDTAVIKHLDGEKFKDDTVSYASPLGTGVAPFAFVGVKSAAGWHQILVAAVVDDQVFGIDAEGHVLKAARADVKPLDVQLKNRKKDDKVVVFEGAGSAETKNRHREPRGLALQGEHQRRREAGAVLRHRRQAVAMGAPQRSPKPLPRTTESKAWISRHS